MNSSELFSCPEEGCVMSYQRHSALQHHLDCGRHTRVLEQKMLLDKTTVGYYVMLEAAMSTIPEAGQDRDPTESPGDCYRAHQYPFSGLGTKSAGTKRLRKYLTNVFKVG